jgi:hypothetical protein
MPALDEGRTKSGTKSFQIPQFSLVMLLGVQKSMSNRLKSDLKCRGIKNEKAEFELTPITLIR